MIRWCDICHERDTVTPFIVEDDEVLDLCGGCVETLQDELLLQEA